MAKKTTSKTQKDRYEVYKKDQSWKTNREAKLKRHLELHPEDAIAAAALRNLASQNSPRRKTPIGKESMRTSGRVFAQLKRLQRALERSLTFVKPTPVSTKK